MRIHYERSTVLVLRTGRYLSLLLHHPLWHSQRRLVWCPNEEEIFAAKNLFEQFCAEGLVAYRVDADGGMVEQLDSFDPFAEEVVFRGVPENDRALS